MNLAQRGGSIPEAKQGVITFYGPDIGTRIQEMIDKYAVRVVSLAPIDTRGMLVVYEEEE